MTPFALLETFALVFFDAALALFFLAAFLPATAALKVAPAVKRGTVVAAILSSLPVCGLRPTRAARFDDLKVPKPTRVTVSPLDTAFVTAAITASSALPAAALLRLSWFRAGIMRPLNTAEF